MEKISVLMPVRNGAHFLSTSIQDIELNVQPADEILVVDDGSVDSTLQILSDWSKRNDKVRIIKSEGAGLVAALNLGISEASNNWIARFDVDDNYEKSRLTEQRKLISNTTSAIFCDYSFHNPEGDNLGVIPSAVSASACALSLVSSQRTPHPGVLFNKNAVLDVGAYQKEDFPAEDISLWLRLAKAGQIVSVPKVLLNYRLSKKSVSAENRKLAIFITSQLIRKIGINESDVKNCLNDWSEQFQSYSEMTYAAERKILFYRDLNKCLSLLPDNSSFKKETRQIALHLLKNVDLISGLSYLMAGKVKRKIYRLS